MVSEIGVEWKSRVVGDEFIKVIGGEEGGLVVGRL